MAQYKRTAEGIAKRRVRQLAAQKLYQRTDRGREICRASSNRYTKRVRLAALGAYGGLCVCCGETEFAFLSIDHISGGGSQHRKALKKSGTSFYVWLKHQSYPDGFQVLCMNCNFAKGAYGSCPHRRDGNRTV